MRKGLKILYEKKDYILCSFLVYILLFFLFDLKNCNLSIPFEYDGDVISCAKHVKEMIESGVFWFNNSLGAPFGSAYYNFPFLDTFQLIVLWGLGRIFKNVFLLLNLYYLLTFFLVSISTLFVLKKFSKSIYINILGSVIFAFLPYHFARGEQHLLLSAYYFVPIAVYYLFLFYDDQLNFFKNRRFAFNKNNLFIMISLVLMGMTGIYYAFFTCFFVCIIFIIKLFDKDYLDNAINSFCFLISIIVGVMINFIPNIYAFFKYASVSSAAVVRSFSEAELYSLKLVQMLLPANNHRNSFLNHIKNIYNGQGLLVNENSAASLGMILSIGLIISLLFLFIRNTSFFSRAKDIRFFASLNIAAILLGTMGGMSTIVAFFLKEIRAYNRISIFIAFFSLLTLILIIDPLIQKFYLNKKSTIKQFIIFVLLVVFVIYDQTPNYQLCATEKVVDEFKNDKQFVNKIENIEEENAMIFQLPYLDFPECGSAYVNKMRDYDPMKAYLHSNKLSWSYGAIKGTNEARWIEHVSKLSANDLIYVAKYFGYEGIYIDKYGYADNEFKILYEELNLLFGSETIMSLNERLFYYDLSLINLNELNVPENLESIIAEYNAIKMFK